MNIGQRTVECGVLGVEDIGREVTLNGWAHRQRDFGDLVFIDLRDRTGIVQVVIDARTAPELVPTANSVRSEYVLSVRGAVRARRPGTENPNLKTGQVEVEAQEIEILNASRTLPFQVADESNMTQVDETLRVKYRYLDLRRPQMYQRLELRHRAVKLIRDYFDARGFLEIETPLFTKSTPEGARDYLVPYRLDPGSFYALPQSPQQYKQLLMVAGCERYFQIARCFRDEAQRADRQPEFTQLDVEMSFVSQEDVLEVIEGYTRYVVSQLSEKEMLTPFPRLTWDEAMRRYGSDKPDIRFGLELIDLSEIAAGTEFSVFQSAIEGGGQVKAIRYPEGARLSRKEVDDLQTFCKEFGARGLATVAVTEPNAQGVKSALTKFLTEVQIGQVLAACEAEAGDLICIVADTKRSVVANVLSRLRLEIGRRLGLRDPNKLYFSIITDFPLVQWNEEEQRWDAEHHPFTSPYEEHLPYFDTDPSKIRAQCYDLVCNGQESGSGSIRIHRADTQSKVFTLLGIPEETQKERFGHILEAFSYGAPPHGGFATGIDRLLMNLIDEPNIREVMAFPKMGLGYDPMMDAPSHVDEAQLRELGLRIIPHKKELSQPDDTQNLLDIEQHVARHYDLQAGPITCTLIRKGFNHNYLVASNDTRFVFRIYLNRKYYIRSDGDFRFELDWLRFLVSEGLPVAQPIARRDGQLLGSIDTVDTEARSCALFTFAPGEKRESLTEFEALALGRSLARLHTASDRFSSEHHRYHLDLRYLTEEPLDQMDTFLRDHGRNGVASFRPRIVELEAAIQNLPTDPPAYGLIHGDLHLGNIHFDAAGMPTYFDFDHSGYGWRAYDLSTCVAGLSDEARNSVLSAYDKLRPLLAVEFESISAFQQIRPIWDVGDVLGMRAAWNNHAKFGADFADELERRLQAL